LTLGVIASVIDEQTEASGPAFALGFILVPVVAAAAAFISGHDKAPTATLKGMGVWLGVALPLALFNPVTGFSAGFAACGALTLRSELTRPGRARWAAVALLALYITALVLILPQAALLAGALTPLLAIRGADMYLERARTRQT
jgi:hypothetical protein